MLAMWQENRRSHAPDMQVSDAGFPDVDGVVLAGLINAKSLE